MFALAFVTSILASCAPCGSTTLSATPSTCILDNTCNGNVCKFQLDSSLENGAESINFRKNILACLEACFLKNENSTLTRGRRYSAKDVYCVLEKYLRCKYNSSLDYKYVVIIYEHFKGDITKIIIFLTHCIHNTSGFKHFIGTDPCHYVPGDEYSVTRGILQIMGKRHYEIAGYAANPRDMAYLNEYTVCASLRVYDCVVADQACFLCNSWLALKPCEVLGENYKLEHYQSRISHRLTVYCDLTAMFNVKGSFSPRGSNACNFLSAYREQIYNKTAILICASYSPLF